jgi:hypothetical protein
MKNSLAVAYLARFSELKLETLVNPLRAAIRSKDKHCQHHQAKDQRPQVFAGKDPIQDHL